MRSLASPRAALRAGVVACAVVAWAQLAVAAESAKSPDEAFQESLKTGKPILALLGSET